MLSETMSASEGGLTLVADFVQVLHDGANRVAVGADERVEAFEKSGTDDVEVVGKDSFDSVF